MSLPSHVKLVEVSPRDGLQNEHELVSTDLKVELINRLSETGLPVIEAGSFVSSKWIPQLADSAEVFKKIKKHENVRYPMLVPNSKGLEAAMEAGVKDIAVFTTPSEQFSKKNTNCSVAESLDRIEKVIKEAKEQGMRVRGYVSCVLGCPYEGEIAVEKVKKVSEKLISLGCEEISLGDTIGVGTPEKTRELIRVVSQKIPIEKLAVHFHDTYGQALANIYAALLEGVSVVDASVAGLGGCPYAVGASGNVATEDVLYMLNGMGIETGVDMEKLIRAGRFISETLGHGGRSKVNFALG